MLRGLSMAGIVFVLAGGAAEALFDPIASDRLVKPLLVSDLFPTTGFHVLGSRSGAKGPLPFDNGTYVTDPALCSLSAAERVKTHGDRAGAMVRTINGRRLDNGYELVCTVSNVRVTGNTIRFRATCEAEGEAEVIEATWERLGESRFRVGQRVFHGCGRLIE